jgi:HAD superfamily hydrolase (TIGR01509 family)
MANAESRAGGKPWFDAVLFDCDGVLVDSEAITCGVLRDMFEEQGWRMTLAECMQRFVGHTVKSQREVIEAHTGRPLTDDWLQQFYQRRNEGLERSVQIVEGALAAVQAAHRLCDGRIACASGADHIKLRLQMGKTGLWPYFEGRVFSGHDMPRSKPAPDVYLAAAAALKVDPRRCLVIEDTPVGARAGVAAGATVWGYCPLPAASHGLQEVGVHRLFPSMAQLPELWSAF